MDLTRLEPLGARIAFMDERWDVLHPAEVGYPDGSTGRPVHRIQPVRVTHHAPGGRVSEGMGSLTFIAEMEGDLPGGRLQLPAQESDDAG